MKIVIGVPIHNCSGFTKYILNNFCNYTYEKHDITFVIVDNASTDDSATYCKEFIGHWEKYGFHNVKFMYERFNVNYGCSKSFNKIYEYFDKEQAELCILINNDIVLSSNWLEQLITFYRNHPEVGIFSPYLIDNHISPETVKEWFGDVRNWKDINLNSIKWQEYVDNVIATSKNEVEQGLQGPLVVITRECRNLAGDWDTGFIKGNYDDLDMSYRAMNLGFMLQVTHSCVIFHFGGSTQWFVTTYDSEKDSYRHKNKAYFEQKWKIKLTPDIVCCRSLLWKHPKPGINDLIEIPTPK